MTWKNYNPVKSLPCYRNLVIDDDTLIPTTDDVAWETYEQHRWVYNKMLVCETQGIPHGPIGTKPTEYPVCVKPITNLMGGSVMSQVCHNEEQYNQITNPGLFWSRYQMGEHYSMDFIVCNGEIVESFVMRGEKLQHGAFDYWELMTDEETYEEAYRNAYSWVEAYLNEYTGCVNIEVIGTAIIEAQLRMGDIDRFGDHTLMNAIHVLHHSGEWNWHRNVYTPKTFYLAALFAQPNTNFTINHSLISKICDNLTYFQIDDPKLYHTNPSHGNRVAIFCNDKWDKVARARNIAAALFKPDIDGRYVDCLRDYEELRL